MKYIICQEPGKFEIKEKHIPIRKEYEALIKINRVGICGTDLHAYQGNQAFFTYPRILGHELAGKIIEIGQNHQNLKAGDSVIIMPYVSCGKCIACTNGKTNCCEKISVLGVHSDGGMQEQFIVPDNILIPSGKLSDEEIAIVEPLSIGYHAIERADLKKEENILVVGCGPIGIGIAKLAEITGANVIVLDSNEGRLKYAEKNLGITKTVKLNDNTKEKIQDLLEGELPTCVFDATGSQKALESGIDYMSHGGRYILVGLSKGILSFHHPSIHAKESSILCSRNATRKDFEIVKSILEKGQFPTKSYVTHKVHFSEMISNFESWLSYDSGVIKAMVIF